MKLFFIAALNLLMILGFFLFAQQKNKNLARQFEQVESNIKSKHELQLAIQNFKTQQQQVLFQNKYVANLEPLKIKTLNFVLGLTQDLPAGISLVELVKSGDTFQLKGIAHSEEALRMFIELRHLRLLKSTGSLFEVSGTL